ncbi:MAG: FtsQ-type POTRA domain-containing protein [Syntrophaceae bacterium]|nr:FtsQ-type POTRA domain-containing protein [Syntrophaceae bacterium]
MEERDAIEESKFFRVKRPREEGGGERFQRILKKTVRVTFGLLLLFFLLFTGHRVYLHLLEDPFFRVREVEVEGNQKIPREALLSLAGLEEVSNLFSLRLKEVARRLASHPWVEEVEVRKVFPSKVRIKIEERRPVAILQLEELYYIDAAGLIFSPVGERDEYNYPVLTGLTREALEKEPVETKRLIAKALELLRILEKERVFPPEEISEIHMERIYGIRCFTKTQGIEVRMGWEEFGEKLRRLSVIWSDLKRRGVSAVSIDCSDVKRMVVKKASS